MSQSFALPIMDRPSNSTGKSGHPLELQSNFFPMSFSNLDAIYQYDVELETMRPPKGAKRGSEPVKRDVGPDAKIFVNRAVFGRFAAARGIDCAYDGRKIAYARSELAECLDGLVLRADRDGEVPPPPPEGMEDRSDEYTVKLTKSAVMEGEVLRAVLAGTIAPTADGVMRIVTAIDVVMAEGNAKRYVEVGRSFYSDLKFTNLGGGAQAWRGFYQTVRLTNQGLTLNVDESFTPFWMMGSLLELVKQVNQGRLPQPNDARAWRIVGKELHNVQVKNRHSGQTARVFGFSAKGASDTTFEIKDTGKFMSITELNMEKYSVAVEHPDLPCVRTSPRRDIFMPISMLDVVKAQRKGKMTPSQTSSMIKTAALKPDKRMESAQGSIAAANYNTDSTCKSFGISVDPTMKTVKARRLDVPCLEYKNNPGGVQPANGSWNMARHKLLHGVGVYHWVVVQIGSYMRGEAINDLVRTMVQLGNENGIPFGGETPEQITISSNLSPGEYEQELSDVVDKCNRQIKSRPGQENHYLQLVVVLKEQQDTVFYNSTKIVCDLRKGVVSQCLLSTKVVKQRRLDQYVSNVLLKINAKLGGYNVKVQPSRDAKNNPQFLSKPHIVLGADVSHSAPGTYGRPSVAAVVGSFDRDACQFSGALRNQNSKQEMIEDMGAMFLEVYERWFNHFGRKWHAESIIMFRDGVAEAQFDDVMKVEVAAIRRACRERCSINPLITYIVCTKRHHSRFFATSKTSPRDLDRNKNVLAGTVIDTDITSSRMWDFYINSHAGIQGTNRPSKYTVLVDENGMTADQLQNYIFGLSHGFARCTRSVSMVNAAYYADLLATRGRVYLKEDGSDDMSMSSGSSTPIPSAEKAHIQLANHLFFV